jgi:UPF0755 protein
MKKNFFLTAVSLVLLFLVYNVVELLIPLPFGNKPIEFVIDRGATFRQVVDALAEKELVRDRWVIYLLGRVTGADRKIKAGYYSLWGTMSPLEIFNAIRAGKIIEYEVTVVPGDSLLEITAKFAALPLSDEDSFSTLAHDREFLRSLGIEGPSLEGYLYPETYRFPKGLEVREVIGIMVDKLREQYGDEDMARMLDLGISENEMLTMASIVEKEAMADAERPVIAGVYYNRLRRDYPLQADPTAIYGVKSSREKITRNDLARKTPYNTYVNKGLPPGPIACPSIKSIRAALNPADVPYLYFVSNDDGTHNFSVTLGQHEESVRSYREKKRARTQG